MDEIHVGPMVAELGRTATVLKLLVTNFALQNQIQVQKQMFLGETVKKTTFAL